MYRYLCSIIRHDLMGMLTMLCEFLKTVVDSFVYMNWLDHWLFSCLRNRCVQVIGNMQINGPFLLNSVL